jgi:serine/threonine protein kinase
MKFRTLADLGQSALGPMRLVRVESGRYNGRLFALQRVDPSVAAIPQLTSAILDDAFITAVVFSRNVVQFIAWGHDDEGTYIAIELVQGASLRHLLKAAAAHKENLPDRVIGFICSELCAGLHALHSVRGPDGDLMGLAHGRLSPSHVLLSFKGEVKIADVGLASAKERVQKAKPEGAGAEVGYLAPEQTDGRAPGAKADLFSFGVLLFELLAGRPPWTASSPEEMQRLIATEPPPDLAALRKWCDPFFLELVRACLEKDPEKRLGSAGKIVELLAEWHTSRGFGDGDQEALAKLVQRLGSHQKEWYRRALGGELVRPDATDLHTALDRVDFGVDPETRRAGGTAPPVPLPAPQPPVPPPPLAPPPPAPQDAAGSRAAAPPPTAPQGRASMRPAPPLDDAKIEKRPRPRAPEARPPEGRPSAPEARPPEGRPSVPEARPPEGRPSVPEARPPEGRPSVPEARPPEGRPSEVPEPRPSVPAGPPVPSVKPVSLVPEPRPSSPAAESWFPAMWPSGRGGEEGRPSAPPSNLSPSARFAFVSRWAASAENAGKDEPNPYRNDRPSQPAVPAASKPGAWVTAAQVPGKAAALPPSVPGGGLAPPRLPSIPSAEQSGELLDAPEIAGEVSPSLNPEPPSSRPEPVPLTLRTGAHALVQRLEKIEKKPG